MAEDVTNFSNLDLSGSLVQRIDYQRINLNWIAGERGHPGVNGDIGHATESTREPADPNWQVEGASMTSTLATYNAEGGITLTTAGADADYGILTPHDDTKQSAWAQMTWGTDRKVHFATVIKTGAALTTCILFLGLKLTNVHTVATDNDQVYFRSVNGAAWTAVDSSGGVDVQTASEIIPAINSVYRFRIEIDASRHAHFFINDVPVAQSQTLAPAVDFKPYIGVYDNGGGAARAITVYGVKMSRDYA